MEDSSRSQTVQALCCEACGAVVCSRDELLHDRAATMGSAVFAYALDICDEEVWSYSATNPAAIRFDVIRVGPSRGVLLRGRPAAEHSWFPPYKWRMAHCCCGHHLGWSFSVGQSDQVSDRGGDGDDGVLIGETRGGVAATNADVAAADNDSDSDSNSDEDDAEEAHQVEAAFHGLIVTKLRERWVTAQSLLERGREQAQAGDTRHVTRQQVEAVVSALFQQAAQQAADSTQPQARLSGSALGEGMAWAPDAADENDEVL